VSAAGQDALSERYGRRRPTPRGRRVTVVAAVLALLAGVGWSAWVARSAADRQVHWESVGYDVRSDTVTVVTFDVTTRGGIRAVCTVEALNASRAEVGLLDVRVGRTDGTTVRASATVPTSERAVVGGVRGCAPTR
jgi:hypothetical protein